MKTLRPLIIVTLALLLSGCVTQQTPLQRVVLAKQTVTVTANTLNNLIDAGAISDADKAQIHLAATAVDESIKMMELAALAGDDGAYRSALSRFNAAMDSLIAKRIAAERKTPPG